MRTQHAKEIIRAHQFATEPDRRPRAWAREQTDLILQRRIEASALKQRPILEVIVKERMRTSLPPVVDTHVARVRIPEPDHD